jgi:dihydrofolate reductase
MQFKIIVATCINNGIGFDKTLPWSIKEDLKHFCKTTKGNGNNAIVMGKNTWDSIGCRILPKRDNLILSKSLYLQTRDTQGGKVFNCIDQLKEWCTERKYEEIWVIGGESIYKQFLNDPMTAEVWVTRIDAEYTCDTFFPDIDSGWVEYETTALLASHTADVSIRKYRKTASGEQSVRD